MNVYISLMLQLVKVQLKYNNTLSMSVCACVRVCVYVDRDQRSVRTVTHDEILSAPLRLSSFYTKLC